MIHTRSSLLNHSAGESPLFHEVDIMRKTKRSCKGIGAVYKPVLQANILANNTTFFIACGVHNSAHMQSALSAYLSDVYGSNIWGTSITQYPGHVYVYKK